VFFKLTKKVKKCLRAKKTAEKIQVYTGGNQSVGGPPQKGGTGVDKGASRTQPAHEKHEPGQE
jgi:hypothetical protein